jgi:hypothetical protein
MGVAPTTLLKKLNKVYPCAILRQSNCDFLPSTVTSDSERPKPILLKSPSQILGQSKPLL